MKLILHPGHAKCGTTSIQKFLNKNRSSFEEEGYLIPDKDFLFPWEKDFSGICETPRNFFQKILTSSSVKELKERVEKFSKFPEKFHSIIISSENLTNRLDGVGYKIHEVLHECFEEVKVIYYIKPQDKYILSAWQQWGYKQGYSLDKYADMLIKNRQPNFRRIVQAYESIYGEKYIYIKPLEKKCLFGEDLLKDFLYNIGIKDNKFSFEVKNNNQSLSPFLCRFLSENTFLFDSIHDEKLKVLLEKLTKSNPLLYERYDELLSYEKRMTCFRDCRKDNIYIQKKYFHNCDYDEIFRPKRISSETNYNETYLSYKDRLLLLLLQELRNNRIKN